MTEPRADVVQVDPGDQATIHHWLGAKLTAIESPPWCRLIAGYVRHRYYCAPEASGLPPAPTGWGAA
jgi:hypothetical protein